MPAMTLAQIKNSVRRSFREAVDPSPDKKSVLKIWEYFAAECAYCGKKLAKSNKDGHIDHLISASKHGKNHISNRALSCSRCNEMEKLDEDWEVFLPKKCPDQGTLALALALRKNKIEGWIKLHSKDGRLKHNEEHIRLALMYAEEVNAVFENRMKVLRSKTRPR